MKYWVVIPAAGSGQRYQNDIPKQYQLLANKTVIEYALAPLLAQEKITAVVVALAPNDTYWAKLPIAQHPKIHITLGGAERYLSVLNGLRYLADQAKDDDWVLVHDAARPLLPAHDIEQLITQLANHSVGGLLGTPVNATLKKVEDQKVVTTVPRTNIWQALTPQMFRYGLLLKALDAAEAQGLNPSDEAQAIENLGYQPVILRGSNDNIKITYPEDLEWAKRLIHAGN